MQADGIEYVVVTDLSPEAVNAIGMEIFKQWVEFASGNRVADGKYLLHPTGRYARAIHYQREGEATVAIVADESVAPEAHVLETGHQAVDLKQKLTKGRRYPMHRGARTFTGYATVGSKGWVIPAMPAYAPARTFALLAAAMAQEGA
jgi:hypothetical protein